jgi:hypothetical protein
MTTTTPSAPEAVPEAVPEDLPADAPHEAALRLRGVLDTALPRELGTPEAPDTYTVAAVFSRRVSPEEQALIEDPTVRDALTAHGYPGVGLAVDDRRLLITRTNLAELENGLAGELADVLRGIDEQITTERIRKAAEVDRWRVAEEQRAGSVKAEADRIHFD